MLKQDEGDSPSRAVLRGPHLIAYADRFGGSLEGLGTLLARGLAGAFDGVHVLPFYYPIDGADAGFDPEDHQQVDPRLGDWADVAALAQATTVTADVIVNHVSVRSKQFADVLAKGEASPYAGMFLTLGSIFPGGATEEQLARIYRPRPGLPFTMMRLGDRPRLVWTTFTPEQVDLDVRATITWDYLTGTIDRLTGNGVSVLRLDAVGYTGKLAGTTCFMTEATKEFITRISSYAHLRGATVLVEMHGHYSQQLDLARRADYVYDFALPPLVLHALSTGDGSALAAWLAVRPANAMTVLDTHDGIGLVDVGPGPGPDSLPGLLSAQQMTDLVASVHDRSGGTSALATGGAASNVDIYQVNSTFYDALGRDDRRMLLARALQLFFPGVPQVYYVGLMAGSNDMELLARTGVGRDVNRHHYSAEEIDSGLSRPVVRAQLQLLRLRASHPAFQGVLSWQVAGSRAELRWRNGQAGASLIADLASGSFSVVASADGGQPYELDDEALLRAG